MEFTQRIEIQSEIKTPTVQEVLARPFQKPDSQYKVVSALLASDGPLKDSIPLAVKSSISQFDSSLKIELSEKQNQAIIDIVCQITGKVPNDFRREVTKRTEQPIDNEEQRMGYVRHLEKGIELFIENGFLTQDIVEQMKQKLLDPAKLKLVDSDTSDFSVRNYDFPSEPVGMNLSLLHVKRWQKTLKKNLGTAGLGDRLSDNQTHDIAAQMAVMHEFGHGVNSYIITKMTQKIAQEAGETFTELDHQKKWGYYLKAHDVYYQMTKEATADKREDLLKGIFNKDEMESTYSEGVAVGSENVALSLALIDQGLTEEEREAVMNVTRKEYEKSVQDFLYFADIVKKSGLEQYQYENLMNQVSNQIKSSGYDIGRTMPYYSFGYNGKSTGYILPLSEDAF